MMLGNDSSICFFEAKLRRQKGIAPGAALFVTRKQENRARGNGSSSNPRNDKPDPASSSGKAKRPKVKFEGCGFSGHTRDKCYISPRTVGGLREDASRCSNAG
jgi:hypothetical protein